MGKDKIILLKRNEMAVLKGSNSKDFVVAEIDNNNLNFSIYSNTSVEEVKFRLAYSISNKSVNTYDFEDEVYLRAKSDTEANAPFCIEEAEDSVTLVDLWDTDCSIIIENMMGCEKDVAKNFEVLEGQPFLMEDEFSI